MRNDDWAILDTIWECQLLPRLDPPQRVLFASLSRKWRRISLDPALWTVVDLRNVASGLYVDDRMIRKVVQLSDNRLRVLLLQHRFAYSWYFFRVTDEGLNCITSNVGNTLEVLDLGLCHEVTCDAVALIAQRCPRLRQLTLDKCGNTNSETVRTLCLRLQSLTHLHLACLPLLTDAVLDALSFARSLEEVDLSFCKELTAHGIQMMIHRSKKPLRAVHVRGKGLLDENTAILGVTSQMTPGWILDHDETYRRTEMSSTEYVD